MSLTVTEAADLNATLCYLLAIDLSTGPVDPDVSIVFLPLFLPIRRPRIMTHAEATQLIPMQPGALVPYSTCPGEMEESELSRALAGKLGPGRHREAVSELWHCTACGYTIHLERDPRGVRRIRNGYPAPSIPPLRVV